MVRRKQQVKKYNNKEISFVSYIVTWKDIVSDSSWQTIDDAKKRKPAIVKSLCYILKKTKTETITFSDYSIDCDNEDDIEIANTNIIPNSVIVNIEKVK